MTNTVLIRHPSINFKYHCDLLTLNTISPITGRIYSTDEIKKMISDTEFPKAGIIVETKEQSEILSIELSKISHVITGLSIENVDGIETLRAHIETLSTDYGKLIHLLEKNGIKLYGQLVFTGDVQSDNKATNLNFIRVNLYENLGFY